MATKNIEDDEKINNASSTSGRPLNRGAWTADEDRKLAQYIEIHGPRRWKSIAIKSGLKRCGKSCRLRWLNYLRPDIKRGNISDAEEDLILRLHRLLGNRWSLIARRLPGRTDNEIKNYWNAHLRKKAKLMEKLPATPTAVLRSTWHDDDDEKEMESSSGNGTELKEIEEEEEESGTDEEEEDRFSSSDGDGHFDFTTQGTYGLEWVKTFLELEEDP